MELFEKLKSNPDFIVKETTTPEMYCLKVIYKGNIIFDRGTFHCIRECEKKFKAKFITLLEIKLQELKINY